MRDLSGSGQYLTLSSSLGIASPDDPIWAFMWVECDNTATSQVPLSLGRAGAGSERRYILLASNTFQAVTNPAAGQSQASTAWSTTGVKVGVLAEWPSMDLRAITVDNGTRATEGTSRPLSNVPNQIRIGATHSASAPFNGRLGPIGIWRGAPTADDARALWAGIHPELIRPADQLDVIELTGRTSPEISLKGNAYTITGSPGYADAPRLFRRHRRSMIFVPGSAADTTLGGSATGAGAVTAALTTSITLGATPSGSGAATGALTTAVTFAAAASASASVAGALTTEIGFVGSLAGTGATAADLSTAIEFATAVTAAGSVTGDLSSAITLAADAAGAATVTADLAAGAGLAGDVSGVATVAGSLSTGITFAAAPTGTATVTGELTTAVTLAGAAQGAATVSAALLTSTSLSGDLAAAGSVSGQLSTDVTFAGVVAGAAQTTAALDTAIFLAGVLTGTATVTAALVTVILPAYDTIRVGTVRSGRAGASGVRTNGSGAAGVRTAYD